LDATAPVFGDFIGFEAMFKVDRTLINIVAMREEQNSPVEVITLSAKKWAAAIESNQTDHGKPPAWKTGPCSFLFKLRQFSTVHV
jgi:hypothetical protein